MLEVKDLVKRYGSRAVVNRISFKIDPGETVGLLGPNGAGKTTTFNMIVGMLKPDEGDVFLNEEKVTALPVYKRARRGIGYLFQDKSVFRGLTVEENILAILERVPGTDRESRTSVLENLIRDFGLGTVRKANADTLSGGERRRLEIARALTTNPSILLLDEPFAAVDPKVKSEIKKIILGLTGRKIAILITDHDVRETLSITDRAYIIDEGKILAEGTPEELIDNPDVQDRYLGKDFRTDFLQELQEIREKKARRISK
ncbi:MAG: LPS export ABC transporter ATP-binding protein [Planctomycetota bacterium]|nr:MAG: LPS export ABC transporter ATP-binding protein [Planctomycetota bacterium]